MAENIVNSNEWQKVDPEQGLLTKVAQNRNKGEHDDGRDAFILCARLEEWPEENFVEVGHGTRKHMELFTDFNLIKRWAVEFSAGHKR